MLGKYILHIKFKNERGELCGKKEVVFIHAAGGAYGNAGLSVQWFTFIDESAQGRTNIVRHSQDGTGK